MEKPDWKCNNSECSSKTCQKNTELLITLEQEMRELYPTLTDEQIWGLVQAFDKQTARVFKTLFSATKEWVDNNPGTISVSVFENPKIR